MVIEYSDLEKKLKQCKVQWYQTSKKRSLKLIQHLEKQVGKPYTGGLQFLDFLSSEFYENLTCYLEEVADVISNYLSFSADNKGRIKLIEDKILKLRDSYQQNQFSRVLTPENFFDDLINPKFSYYAYLTIYSEVEEKIKETTEKEEENYDSIYFPSTEEIFSMAKILMELKLLQAIHLKINSGVEKNLQMELIVPNVKVNKYPKVFRNGYATELFNFLLTEEDKRIGPSWAGKYFLLFKDEKLIKPKAKAVNFLTFLNENIEKKIKVLDNRTGYKEDTEVDFLKEVEKKFQISNGIKRH